MHTLSLSFRGHKPETFAVVCGPLLLAEYDTEAAAREAAADAEGNGWSSCRVVAVVSVDLKGVRDEWRSPHRMPRMRGAHSA